MDGAAAPALQGLGQGDGLFDVPAAFGPVGPRDPHADRPVRREGLADGVEHLERKAEPVLQRAPVRVVPEVRQRRQELVEQVAVRPMDLNGVES
jgi:hypothetical protein